MGREEGELQSVEKAVADNWLALQSELVNQPQRCIKAIVHSADLVTRTQNHIERLLVSIEKARRALETSKSLLRNGAVLNDPGTHWLALDRHFAHHAEQVSRFRTADKSAVRRMWKNQTNEHGEPFSDFERKALIERHCELFLSWPQ